MKNFQIKKHRILYRTSLPLYQTYPCLFLLRPILQGYRDKIWHELSRLKTKSDTFHFRLYLCKIAFMLNLIYKCTIVAFFKKPPVIPNYFWNFIFIPKYYLRPPKVVAMLWGGFSKFVVFLNYFREVFYFILDLGESIELSERSRVNLSIL